MSNRIKNNLKNLVGQTLNQYYSKVKPTISDLRYKQEYQNRIIECMVGEVDDNYITTPETDNPIVKLEHSKEGLVKVPTVKGKTILVDADGNETDTPAEGCKLLSVGEQEDNKLIILSKNKNLFDFSSLILTKSRYALPLKYLEVGKTYTVKTNNIVWFKISEYLDSSKYSYQSTNKQEFTFTMTDTMKKENLFINNKDVTFINDINTLKSLQPNLQLGSSITSLIEPKHHKTEILLDEPLRSIKNIEDRLVKIGGKWCIERNCKKVVVDGSESGWSLMKQNDNSITFRLHNDLVKDALINPPCVSNLFIQDMTSGLIKADNSMRITEYGSLQRLFLVPTVDKCTDLQSFKQWLSENPVTVIYQLAEPIIEELPNGITLQGFDDTTIYIENSITPTVTYGYNALIPYKEELSRQKEEVEINTLDIENNIIPYLMDMEFNLMTMEDK